MTLRVNLLEDPDFRKDLLQMAKGLLREVTRDAMSATLMQEGWLKR